jgi:hypothetical protein
MILATSAQRGQKSSLIGLEIAIFGVTLIGGPHYCPTLSFHLPLALVVPVDILVYQQHANCLMLSGNLSTAHCGEREESSASNVPPAFVTIAK